MGMSIGMPIGISIGIPLGMPIGMSIGIPGLWPGLAEIVFVGGVGGRGRECECWARGPASDPITRNASIS